MPTLTPKAKDKYKWPNPTALLREVNFPKLGSLTDGESANSRDDQTAAPGSSTHLACVDSIRGLLSILVVLHHFRCAFDPCAIFGATAAWIGDPTECPHRLSLWDTLVNTITNGTFAVAVFFTLSGFVLSHGLWKAPLALWRVAVAKRYLRLVGPVAVAMLLAYFCATESITNTATEVSTVTNSRWLVRLAPTRPSPVTGLLSQIFWGVWRRGSNLNNALWTMRYEWGGSMLTFGLVPIMKRLPHRSRSNWLAALFLLCLVPWPTNQMKTSVHVLYDKYLPLPGQPGQKRVTHTLHRGVILDPIHHAHTMRHIQDLMDAAENMQGSVPVQFWDDALHSPTRVEGSVELVQIDRTADSAVIYGEVLRAAGARLNRDPRYSTPRIEVHQKAVRTHENHWLWYAAFVAGMWISEARLSRRMGLLNSKSTGGIVALLWPGYVVSPVVSWLAPCFAALCASYPYTPVLADQSQVWRVMTSIAQLIGYGSHDAQPFWCILGSCVLLYHILLYGRLMRRWLESSSVLQWLGELSFSLYLIHIPILYSVSCTVFQRYYHGHLWHDDTFGSSLWACVLAFPAMIGTAFCLCKAVDAPSVICSAPLAEWMLGLSKTLPSTASTAPKHHTTMRNDPLSSELPTMDETEFSEST